MNSLAVEEYSLENPFEPLDHPNCYQGHQYALDVISGKLPNSKYIIGSCKRYLKFLKRSEDPLNYFYFNVEIAEKYLRRVQQFKHVKGKWKTPNITYEPWQCWLFMNVKGFLWRGLDDPLRVDMPLFRVVHAEVARGNAKSAMASQMLLNELALENPVGNEISCFATKTDQAKIVLDSARAMAKASPDYLKKTGVRVLEHKILHENSNSFARAMSSDDKSLDGLNDKLAVCDELHAMSRELFGIVSSGMSKRIDSILLCITTAGFNTDSVGYEQSNYAKKVSIGEVEDDQFFAAVWTIDEGDDIYCETTWRKSNPGYGVSVDPVTFTAKANKAKITPNDVGNFKVKHLNIWIDEIKAYFSMPHWDKCADPTLDIKNFIGKKCFNGLDLASKIDLTSDVVVFREKGIYYAFDKSFIPKETVDDRKSPIYDRAIEEGHLVTNPGAVVDYENVKDYFKQVNHDFKVLGNHYDPWGATQFAQDRINERIEMTEFRMTTSNLSEATKHLDALIRDGKFRHNGNGLFKYCMGNVVCKEDAGGNVFPRKSSERSKIDIAIACIMAVAGWVQIKEETTVYEERGIRYIGLD